MAEPKCEITRTERVISPGETVLKEKTVTVKGDNMEETKKTFDEEWRK